MQCRKIHVAVTTEGVQVDKPLKTRLLGMVACSSLSFLVAVSCFGTSNMPFVYNDEDAYDGSKFEARKFLFVGTLILVMSLAKGLGQETVNVSTNRTNYFTD